MIQLLKPRQPTKKEKLFKLLENIAAGIGALISVLIFLTLIISLT